MRQKRSSGRLALFLLCIPLTATGWLGAASPARAETDVTTELTLGALFDNNAALGRRGQFGAEAVVDVTSVVGAQSNLVTDLGTKRARFVLFGKLRAEEGRWRQYLRNTEVTLKPGFEIDLTKMMTLRPEVGFKLRREVEEVWGYLEVTPALVYTLHTRMGLVLEASYEFAATQYDSDALTNTYANVDRLSHLARVRAKIWQSQFLRYQIKAEVEHQRYDDNLDYKLTRILFAPIEEYNDPDVDERIEPSEREDLVLRGEVELLGVPTKSLALAAGYRFEYDRSNLDAFRSWSHGPRLAVILSLDRHEAFFEGRVTFYDFYDFRFDVRYRDTRRDIKTELFAAYQFKVTKAFILGLKATFLRNDSNDAATFDDGTPRFDPDLSRSYSLYQGTRIEAYLRYTWDTSAGKAAPPDKKKDKDKVPGMILADR
jgi:hypothetical protein